MAWTIEQLEHLVRSGDLGRVARILRETNSKSIPRADLGRYAQLANRVGQAQFTLRLLHPIVRSDSPAVVKPTDQEKLEYAAALRLKGVFREAVELLEEIDSSRMPIVHLRIASCLMSQWKYAEAIPFLRAHIASVDPKEYSHVIARVNLAASLVCEEQDEEALELLTVLVIDTKAAGHNLLCGNSLELMAQILIRKNQFERAEKTLHEAAGLFSGNARYELYLRKWHSVSRSLKSGRVDQSLHKCRAEASQQMEWETVRDCDLYIGTLNGDHSLLNHLYVGTPFAPYRKRILSLTRGDYHPAGKIYWTQSPGAIPLRFFDVLDGEGLDRGRLMHRTLLHLTSDFYRPATLYSAFAELFPDESCIQQGRLERVHQSICRLRDWFNERDLPIRIDHHKGHYRLGFAPDMGLLVHAEKIDLTNPNVKWLQLNAQLKRPRFNKRDVMSALDCSSATAKRLITWALECGKIKPIGNSTQRKYIAA